MNIPCPPEEVGFIASPYPEGSRERLAKRASPIEVLLSMGLVAHSNYDEGVDRLFHLSSSETYYHQPKSQWKALDVAIFEYGTKEWQQGWIQRLKNAQDHNRIGDAIAAAIMVQNQEATFSLLNSLTIGTVLKDQIKKNLMAALLNKEPRHWDVECAKVLTSLGCVLEDDLYDGDKDHSGENSTDAYPMYDCIEQDNVELMAYYLPFADPKIFKPADCFDGALGYGSIECLVGSLNNHDVQATLNAYPMEWANAIVEGIEMTARSSNEKQEDGVNRNTTANISEIFKVLLNSTPPLFSQVLEQKLLNFCLNNKNPLSALAEHAVLKNAAHPAQGASRPKVRI